MPFRWPTASAGTRFSLVSLSLSLWLHQRAHNFKLALDATSEGLATREEGVGGGVGSASVATFHSYGLAEISPAPAPAPS